MIRNIIVSKKENKRVEVLISKQRDFQAPKQLAKWPKTFCKVGGLKSSGFRKSYDWKKGWQMRWPAGNEDLLLKGISGVVNAS